MSRIPFSKPCPDCASGPEPLTRRSFVSLWAAAAAGLVLPGPLRAQKAAAGGETLVGELYKSLDETQRQAICFGFDDPLRQKVDNNWHIVKASIGKIFKPDQQDLVRQIFTSLHSPEYVKTVWGQVEHDNEVDGGFPGCAVAIFGEPGTGKFEFVLSGRHVTRRCDGDSVAGAAFGGPIFYGHAAAGFNEAADHPGNVYWFQALRANEVFKSLDSKHQQMALREDARPEAGTETIRLSKKKEELHGVPCSDLSGDQKELVGKVLADLLAPFRESDRIESMKLIQKQGGVDSLHMAFYQNLDIGEDRVWDVWQIEGPGMVWYFRGSPHVHTWVNIQSPA